ncbi:YebC/PmpR family DNA-binding transcriptional regulator [Kallotenue papyrolyticum]|uniref:YebC/PmpR family DNA-binding transcriptional regulator n=1 Tax=Kallotenue papyrolyticum TaxID=1325125 RepID=UPI00047853BD|nr:YebC/PmpR family DNA-binding transcriptional regulator [Kallotenue papyrolyticum]
MSGHTKWHEIRRKKGVLDQRRGQLFTKLAREITVATREGGSGDPDLNFRLRLAIERAKQNNMPAENIQRAIDRGLGKGNEAAIEEIWYEGYAPGGVAIMVQAATDNRNRTAAEVRSTFSKHGGNLGESGSVAWMFEQKGLITIEFPPGQAFDADEVMLQVIDAGAEDVEVDGNVIEVYTAFEDLNAVRSKLQAQGLPITNAERLMKAKTPYRPDDEATAMAALRLMEKLEELDDVQKVYSNLDVSEELADRFAASA